MKNKLLLLTLLVSVFSDAQIGKRFPSEKKVVKDPVTGTMLSFLTSKPSGDTKIYQTHTQWTSDGQWVIFRSGRARNEAIAVNEKTGDMVQVTEGGYTGMLCIARKSMKLYFMQNLSKDTAERRRGGGTLQVMEVDLQKVFSDTKKQKMQPASVYQRV